MTDTHWHPITTAPTDRPISLVVQFWDESGQRIIPSCMYKGCPHDHRDNGGYTLADYGESATHWGEPIPMPEAV